MCIIDEDHMIYGSWNIRCSRQNFLLFWAMFCTFTPLKTWKIKIVTNKKKKTPGDIIILHMCIINDNHMMYGSWDMEHNGLTFLLFWTIFTLFNPENQNFEKMKKIPGYIIILHMHTINDKHMMYGSWDMGHDRQNFLSFRTIFLPF